LGLLLGRQRRLAPLRQDAPVLGEAAPDLSLGHHPPVDVVEGGEPLALAPVGLVADEQRHLPAQPGDELVVVVHAVPWCSAARPAGGEGGGGGGSVATTGTSPVATWRAGIWASRPASVRAADRTSCVRTPAGVAPLAHSAAAPRRSQASAPARGRSRAAATAPGA